MYPVFESYFQSFYYNSILQFFSFPQATLQMQKVIFYTFQLHKGLDSTFSINGTLCPLLCVFCVFFNFISLVYPPLMFYFWSFICLFKFCTRKKMHFRIKIILTIASYLVLICILRLLIFKHQNYYLTSFIFSNILDRSPIYLFIILSKTHFTKYKQFRARIVQTSTRLLLQEPQNDRTHAIFLQSK